MKIENKNKINIHKKTVMEKTIHNLLFIIFFKKHKTRKMLDWTCSKCKQKWNGEVVCTSGGISYIVLN